MDDPPISMQMVMWLRPRVNQLHREMLEHWRAEGVIPEKILGSIAGMSMSTMIVATGKIVHLERDEINRRAVQCEEDILNALRKAFPEFQFTSDVIDLSQGLN